MEQRPAVDRDRALGARTELRGRTAEVEAIDDLLNDARTGRAGVMTLVGDVGIGKSALLEYAAARANDLRVLRCVGAPAEVELAFAGLQQMLRPLLGLIDRLPARQAMAIRGVFGLSEDRVEDRFVISVAALSVLSEAAEDLPLACIVDEVGSLDHESAETLAFVARRLEGEPIAFLVALTDEEAQHFSVPRSVRVQLRPLGDEDALAVIRDAAPTTVSRTVADEMVRAAAGVPLLLRELVASLTPDQLKGHLPLPVALPVSPAIEELYLARVQALPEASRSALLVAAATQFEELKTVVAALEALGLEEEALDQAARNRLLDISDRITFPHPAVRLAVYAGASPAERRRVHDALASVLVDDSDEDVRVWHRALATLGPDEAVADALERSADRAAARSGCATAASALERAAALSGDETGRARRLARAAEMAWLSGQPDRAMAFAAEAEAVNRDPVIHVRIDFVRAAWEAQHGVTADAIPLFLHAAEVIEDRDPDTALRLQLAGMLLMSLVGRQASQEELERLERLVRRTPQADHAPASVVEVNEWMAAGATTPVPCLPEDVSSLVERLDDQVLAPFAIRTAAYLGDLGAARINGELVVRRERTRGALAILSFGLRELAGVEFLARRFDDAQIHAAEGLRLGIETGNDNVVFVHRGILAAVAAVRGEEATCRDEADAARFGAIERNNRDAIAWANGALGHLELSLGRLEASERFSTVWAQPVIGEPRLFAAADAVEAAVRGDRADIAELRLAELGRWATHTDASWALPLVARCRALLASGDEAERLFEEALRLHESTGAPFERARTQLLFGELLRRERRRAEARPHLRAAVETFASVRAAIWEERARTELRATGEVLRHHGPDAIWQLTPQELQIARLVAKGASNRDAAAELFLSPRTVEYHLRKVFAKLGIASRTELVRMSLADVGG